MRSRTQSRAGLYVGCGSVFAALDRLWAARPLPALRLDGRHRSRGSRQQPSAEAGTAARFVRPTSVASDAGVPLPDVRPSTRALEVMRAVAPVAERTGMTPAPGTRSEVTANEQFYRIDINTMPPMIDTGSWRLACTGLFSSPSMLSFTDLMSMPEATQPITMCCISNPVGGSLISTAFFTGIRLRDILEHLGVQPEARSLAVRAIDGYYETISQEDMFDPRTLLVYGMNGRTLSAEQGYPVRFFIPNRYGMKQPKWVTGIQAVSETDSGFWVDRGWSREARPKTLSIIDTIASGSAEDGRVPVGGIAWAGARGIQQVEVQVDGQPWEKATLLAPPLGPLTWVLWRYDWPVRGGMHVFRVRATDSTGTLQTAERTGPHPNGATGYHEVSMMT